MQALMVLGGLLVLASAIMAALGFRGREQVVGIDLGTTFSVVALRSKDKAGVSTITVLPDRITGRLLVPSVVHFMGNGTVLVGDDAVERRGQYPKQTIFNAKRFVGRSLSEVAGDSASHPYDVRPHPVNATPGNMSEAAGFLIPHEDGVSDSKWVSPVEVGAEVVKHLKRSIASYIGYEISRAVICVPAKFTAKEIKATEQAFNQAGFKVQRVLEEPTAAAMAYGLHKEAGVKHVLVYDIGGGTLDTCLLYMNGKSVSVLSVAGDDHLGGSDFDLAVQKLLLHKLTSEGMYEVLETTPRTSPHTLQSCSENGLLIEGEAAKIRLSSEESVVVHCRAEDDGSLRATTISREDFEEVAAQLFSRSMAPVEKVLSDAMMRPEDVNDVVLVGGASRMPKLRMLLQAFFGESQRLHTDIDPDVTIAYGAANVLD